MMAFRIACVALLISLVATPVFADDGGFGSARFSQIVPSALDDSLSIDNNLLNEIETAAGQEDNQDQSSKDDSYQAEKDDELEKSLETD